MCSLCRRFPPFPTPRLAFDEVVRSVVFVCSLNVRPPHFPFTFVALSFWFWEFLPFRYPHSPIYFRGTWSLKIFFPQCTISFCVPFGFSLLIQLGPRLSVGTHPRPFMPPHTKGFLLVLTVHHSFFQLMCFPFPFPTKLFPPSCSLFLSMSHPKYGVGFNSLIRLHKISYITLHLSLALSRPPLLQFLIFFPPSSPDPF